MAEPQGIKHIEGRKQYKVYWVKPGVTLHQIEKFITDRIHPWFPQHGVTQADFYLATGKRSDDSGEEITLVLVSEDEGNTDWSSIVGVGDIFEMSEDQTRNGVVITHR
ncbi:MAG TPA: hypothetical protein VJ810_26520, partial [Blastocatellia bacterium]|nr:hypothetical protein [Blastocatellia bacterium]